MNKSIAEWGHLFKIKTWYQRWILPVNNFNCTKLSKLQKNFAFPSMTIDGKCRGVVRKLKLRKSSKITIFSYFQPTFPISVEWIAWLKAFEAASLGGNHLTKKLWKLQKVLDLVIVTQVFQFCIFFSPGHNEELGVERGIHWPWYICLSFFTKSDNLKYSQNKWFVSVFL